MLRSLPPVVLSLLLLASNVPGFEWPSLANLPTLPPMPWEKPAASAIPGLTPDQEATLRLQIFLDRQGFPPGKVDGKPGEFLGKAVGRYQLAHGLPVTGVAGAGIPPVSTAPTVVTYTITADDLRQIGRCPTTVEAQATQTALPYATVQEFLTERFHCAPKLLQTLNPTWTSEDLPVGATVQVPNVEPFRIEALPRIWPAHPAFRQRIIQVHRAERMLDLWEGKTLLASFPITPGGGTVETPAGHWHLTAIAVAPTFRWDRSVLETGKRSDTFFLLPAGPNNPVGVLWCALNRPGIGLHGTDNPQTIGRATSHGCIRLANWDIVRLAAQVTPGVQVDIE